RADNGELLRVRPDEIAYIRLGNGSRSTSDSRYGSFNTAAVMLGNGDALRGRISRLDANSVQLTNRNGRGRERVSPLSDVTMIGFSGDPTRDPGDVPSTGTRRFEHVLVMRDGREYRGRFMGPSRSTSGSPAFLFRDRNGRLVTFTAADADRLYLW